MHETPQYAVHLSDNCTPPMQVKPSREKLVFGATMSDHMLEIDYEVGKGWSAPVITPYHPLAIDPAASCLHYGLEVRHTHTHTPRFPFTIHLHVSSVEPMCALSRRNCPTKRAWGVTRLQHVLQHTRCSMLPFLTCFIYEASTWCAHTAHLRAARPSTRVINKFPLLQAFEGMKAYLDAAGKVRMFRPDLNMARLSRSMEKLSFPTPLDQTGFLDCIKQLVLKEK